MTARENQLENKKTFRLNFFFKNQIKTFCGFNNCTTTTTSIEMSLLLKTIWNRLVMYIFNQRRPWSSFVNVPHQSPHTKEKRKNSRKSFFYFFSLTVEDYPPGMCRTFLGFLDVFTLFVTMWARTWASCVTPSTSPPSRSHARLFAVKVSTYREK